MIQSGESITENHAKITRQNKNNAEAAIRGIL